MVFGATGSARAIGRFGGLTGMGRFRMGKPARSLAGTLIYAKANG